MSTQLLESPRPRTRPKDAEPAPGPPPNSAFLTAIRVVALLLIAAFLLFAHGCHGDEDNELFAALRVLLGN